MRIIAYTALLLLGAADKLPPPTDTAHLPQLTAAEQAAQDMLRVYEEFCLNRFPNPVEIANGIAAHKLTPATAQDASATLMGRPGQAWALTNGLGRYTLAITTPPQQGCVVTGAVADDESLRAIFSLAVQAFASANDLGKLDSPMLRHGTFEKSPALLQLIGTTGTPHEAFVNLSWVAADGKTHGRLAREFPPPGK